METNITSASTASTVINWKQIGSLAALNAAIAISWIAYFNYQEPLVVGFKLGYLVKFLIAAQGIIMVALPPLAGLAADYMIRKNSNYFVVYTVGISVCAMVFMIVTSTLKFNEVAILRSALPIMIILWLISMNVFHSPANSMVEMFAPAQQLPKVMAFITVITGMIMALEPIIVQLIMWMGPVYTFAAGGIALVITGYIFRRTTGQIELKRKVNDEQRKSSFGTVILAGLLFGILLGLVNNDAFIGLTDTKFVDFAHHKFGTRHFATIVLAVAALLAFPAASVVSKRGLTSSLLVGTVIGISGFLLIWLMNAVALNIAGCILMGVGLSISAVSAFPLALNNLAPKHVAFGTGIFFGSSEILSGLLNYLTVAGYFKGF